MAALHDPKKLEYMEVALTPTTDHDIENLEMFQSAAAEAFVAREQRRHVCESVSGVADSCDSPVTHQAGSR